MKCFSQPLLDLCQSLAGEWGNQPARRRRWTRETSASCDEESALIIIIAPLATSLTCRWCHCGEAARRGPRRTARTGWWPSSRPGICSSSTGRGRDERKRQQEVTDRCYQHSSHLSLHIQPGLTFSASNTALEKTRSLPISNKHQVQLFTWNCHLLIVWRKLDVRSGRANGSLSLILILVSSCDNRASLSPVIPAPPPPSPKSAPQ